MPTDATTVFKELSNLTTEGTHYDFKANFYDLTNSQRTFISDVARLHNSLGVARPSINGNGQAAFLIFGVKNHSNIARNDLLGLPPDLSLPDPAVLQDLVRVNLRPSPTILLHNITHSSGTGRFALLEILICPDGPVRFEVKNLFDESWRERRPTRMASHNVPYDQVDDTMWKQVCEQFSTQQDDIASRKEVIRVLENFSASKDPHTLKVLFMDKNIDTFWDGTSCCLDFIGCIPWNVVIDLGNSEITNNRIQASLEKLVPIRKILHSELNIKRKSPPAEVFGRVSAGCSTLWITAQGASKTGQIISPLEPLWSEFFSSLSDGPRPVVAVTLLSEIVPGNRADPRHSLIEGPDRLMQSLEFNTPGNQIAVVIGSRDRDHLSLADSLLKAATRVSFHRPEQFIRTLVDLLGSKLPPDSIPLPNNASLRAAEASAMKNAVTLYSTELSTPPSDIELRREIRNQFLRGGELSTTALLVDEVAGVNVIVKRPIMQDVHRRLEQKLSELSESGSQAEVVSAILSHPPTSGGTTTARWVAWKLRKAYPTMLVISTGNILQDTLLRLWKLCCLPLLLVIDRGTILEGVGSIVSWLKRSNIPAIVLQVNRLVKGNGKHHPASFMWTVPREVEQPEKSSFIELFCQLRDESARLNTVNRIFFWGIIFFAHEYELIKSHVTRYSQDMTPSERMVIRVACLFWKHTDQRVVPWRAVALLLNKPASEDWVSKRNELMRVPISELLISDEKGLRPPISDVRVLHFISDVMSNDPAPEMFPQREDAKNLLETVKHWMEVMSDIIKKEENSPENDMTVDLLIKRRHDKTFSSLVETVSRGLGTDEAVSLLQDAADGIMCGDPHVRAHLARFLVFKCNNAEQALDTIRLATESNSNVSLNAIHGDVARQAAHLTAEKDPKQKDIIMELVNESIEAYSRAHNRSDNTINPHAMIGEAKARMILLKRISADGTFNGSTEIQLHSQEITRLIDRVEQAMGGCRVTNEESTKTISKLQSVRIDLLQLLLKQNETLSVGRLNTALKENDYSLLALAGMLRTSKSPQRKWEHLQDFELSIIIKSLHFRVMSQEVLYHLRSDYLDLVLARFYLAQMPSVKHLPKDLVTCAEELRIWNMELPDDGGVHFWSTAVNMARYLSNHSEPLLHQAKERLNSMLRNTTSQLPVVDRVRFSKAGTMAALCSPSNQNAAYRFYGQVVMRSPSSQGTSRVRDEEPYVVSEALPGIRARVDRAKFPEIALLANNTPKVKFVLALSYHKGFEAEEISPLN